MENFFITRVFFFNLVSLQCRRFRIGACDRKFAEFAAILAWEKWVGRGRGKMEVFFLPLPLPLTSPFSLTPTPHDTFSSLPKPLPSLNPRWRSLDQKCTRSAKYACIAGYKLVFFFFFQLKIGRRVDTYFDLIFFDF